jgi:hypothetical protein
MAPGDAPGAQEHHGQAARPRPQLTCASPVLAVQTLMELARAYLALEDHAAAKVLLGEASDFLKLRPDLGILQGG